MEKKGPFRGDQVGSLLRPNRLKEARGKFADNKITGETLRLIENEEIERIVAEQKKVGIKSITDGELRRSWWHIDFLENLNGIEGYQSETQYNFNGIMVRPYNVRVVDKVSFNENHPFLEHFKFLQKTVGTDGEFVAKQTIPSPNMLLHDKIANYEVYPDFDKYLEDLSTTYKEAIKAFYKVGCRYLQIDDTHWAYLAATNKEHILNGEPVDVDYLAEKCAKVLNDALENRPADLVVTMHICRGNFSSSWVYEGGYERVAKHLFTLDLDGYFLEYDSERAGSFEALKDIYRPGVKIVLGLITSKVPALENPEEIKAQIKEASNYVPLIDLCLSPQCGFASTEEGNHLTEAEQWAKLALVSEISRDVWDEE